MFSERKLALSADRLREVLRYDPETGLFYWRISRGSVAAGTQAGKRTWDGYSVIRIDGTEHYAHRLAWLYVHGEHPTAEIDHKDRNPADNRIANLRQSSHAENTRNRARHNRSGFKGVTREGSKWRATISVGGRNIWLGYHPTAEKAAAAYDEAARLYHGEFAQTNEMLGLLPPRESRAGCPDSTTAPTSAPQQQVSSEPARSAAAPMGAEVTRRPCPELLRRLISSTRVPQLISSTRVPRWLPAPHSRALFGRVTGGEGLRVGGREAGRTNRGPHPGPLPFPRRRRA
jgi:HNH endonuclease/AP2 domain